MANPAYVRNNAWNEGGTFDNPDLLWYAKGVARMMSRPIADPQSWWFYAAIHGEYANPDTSWYPQGFPAWQFIAGPPSFATTPLPSTDVMTQYWDQCQHGTWYFLPWHRGYVLSIEAQLRQDIIDQGGPASWALPYWDYFGDNGSQFPIPPALMAETLPGTDNTPNPLYVKMRYGPNGDNSNVFIPTPASKDKTAGFTVTDTSLNETVFSYPDMGSQILPGFGGPVTTFSHNGNTHGHLEHEPHDMVHVAVGGFITDDWGHQIQGLMADPNTAGLDPVFYLHHCNIDRMWASWNAANNTDPLETDWLNGPAPQFVMPVAPNGQATQPWLYTPEEMQSIDALGYGYQALTSIPVEQAVLAGLGAAPETLAKLPAAGALADFAKTPAATAQGLGKEPPTTATELLGASTPNIIVQNKGVSTPVWLNKAVQNQSAARLTNSLAFANTDDVAKRPTPPRPDKIFLKLENITGTFDATVLNVYLKHVGTPAAVPSEAVAAPAAEDLGILAGHVGLFGLRLASLPDGKHGGQGLTFTLNITDIVNLLYLSPNFSASELSVTILPNKPLSEPVHIGIVSVYRQAF